MKAKCLTKINGKFYKPGTELPKKGSESVETEENAAEKGTKSTK